MSGNFVPPVCWNIAPVSLQQQQQQTYHIDGIHGTCGPGTSAASWAAQQWMMQSCWAAQQIPARNSLTVPSPTQQQGQDVAAQSTSAAGKCDRFNTPAMTIPTDNKADTAASPSTSSTMASPSTSTVNEDDHTLKDKDKTEDPWHSMGFHAFIGPSLWGTEELKMEFMDLDEFLSENGIETGNRQQAENYSLATPTHSSSSSDCGSSVSVGRQSATSFSLPSFSGDDVSTLSGHSRIANSSASDVQILSGNNSQNDLTTSEEEDDAADGDISCCPSPASDATFSAVVSKSRRSAVNGRNASSDNKNYYVPGVDFDPKSRAFTEEELMPHPMSKKSQKQYVPPEMKDDKYWSRRKKNNLAAKRSRDARRAKENQIALRAAYLEKENASLKAELDKVNKLYAAALKRLEQYEKTSKK